MSMSKIAPLGAEAESLLHNVWDHLPGHSGLEDMRNEHQQEVGLLRDQIYILSKAIGDAQSDLNRDLAMSRLRQWVETDDQQTKAAIEKHLSYEGSLVVTDMSGFTRITREEGILHFLMLIKQMQCTRTHAAPRRASGQPASSRYPPPIPFACVSMCVCVCLCVCVCVRACVACACRVCVHVRACVRVRAWPMLAMRVHVRLCVVAHDAYHDIPSPSSWLTRSHLPANPLTLRRPAAQGRG